MSYKLRNKENYPCYSYGDNSMQNIYENKDFYLSAFLIASGIKLLTHRRDGSITVFGFEKNNKVQILVDQYYTMSGSVKPMKYGASIRSLKNILHSVASESYKELNHEFTHKQQGKSTL